MDEIVGATNGVQLSDNGMKEYENLKNYLLLKFQKPYTTAKVLSLLSHAVKFMTTVKTITGEEKKQIVLSDVRECINMTDLSAETKAEMILVVDTFGDTVIEEFIEFGRDMISFAKKKCEGCSTSRCTIC